MNQLLEILWSFFKIGAFTFGGGYAMIPLIEKEVVEGKEWISKEEFMDVLAIAQSLPGAMSINLSIFIGYKRKGVLGGVFALLGSAFPSFFIILLIAMFFMQFNTLSIVQKVFLGIRPAVVSLIAIAVVSLGKNMPRNKKTISMVLGFTFFLVVLNLHPIFALILGAGIGMFTKGDKNDSL